MTDPVPPTFPKPNAADGDAAAAFDELSERALREMLALDPVRAAWLGAGEFLGTPLPDPSPEGQQREVATLRALCSAFESADASRLSPQQAVDRDLVLGRLAIRLEQLEEQPRWRTAPQAAVEEILSALSAHLLRDCGPPEERWPALLGCLEAAPTLLRTAARSLENPPGCYTDTASQMTEEALRSLPAALAEIAGRVEHRGLADAMRRAADGLLAALRAYAEFLRGDLMPRSLGDFRLGADAFNRILRLDYRLPLNLDELVQLGERTYHETLREIRSCSAAIRPGRNWSELLLELKDEHPAAEELLPVYRDAVASARRFVEERQLAPLPETDDLRLAETPPFARARIPHALYIECGALGGRACGSLLLTSPDPAASPAHRRAALRWHSRHAIPMRAARETYPGRHLRHAWTAVRTRRLRLLCPSPLLTEGWALYSEGLMSRAGYCPDERVRLLQLQERLLCSCRVLTDIALHTGQLSPHEAAAFLVRKAKVERASAAAEVRRCCEHPALPMSCIVGQLLIRELRGDWEEQHPGAAPASFHADLLRHGALPFDLLRREMGLPPGRSGRDLLLRVAPPPHRAAPATRH